MKAERLGSPPTDSWRNIVITLTDPGFRRTNGASLRVLRLFTTVDCGLSTSTRWISSVIADFGLLPCVLFCDSSA